MLKIEEIKDGNIINKIIIETGSKEAIHGNNDLVSAEELINEKATHYLFKKDEDVMGYCSLVNPSGDFVWIDVVFYPQYRGKEAITIAKKAMFKYFMKIGCPINFIAKIHKKNKASLFYTMWLGFKKVLETENFNIMGINYERRSSSTTNN